MEEEGKVYGDTSQSVSNVIAKGRYKFTVIEATDYRKGNDPLRPLNRRVVLQVENKKITEYLCQDKGKNWRDRQFLHAIGIRRKQGAEDYFIVKNADLIGKTGLCDVVIETSDYGGYEHDENRIVRFMPEEEIPSKELPTEKEMEKPPAAEPPKSEKIKEEKPAPKPTEPEIETEPVELPPEDEITPDPGAGGRYDV